MRGVEKPVERTRRSPSKPKAEREKRASALSSSSSSSSAPALHVGAQAKRHGAIVSSSHLAVSAMPELSEFEFGLIVVNNSFSRWIARCMAAAGLPGLTPMDVLVLHHVHHRARDKRLADIAFTLNVEDLHVVNYALKKLLAAGVVEATKHGKEVLYRTNDEGKHYIDRYREVRERCLVAALSPTEGDGDTVHETARILRWLSGLYDQAARAATSL
jgi:predicted MarR family transcription regulator